MGSAVKWQDVEGMMEVGRIPVKLGQSGLAEIYVCCTRYRIRVIVTVRVKAVC